MTCGGRKRFDALVHLASWVPDYLDFDEARALAAKALWGLGDMPGSGATLALERLRVSENMIVKREAEAQLRRRAERGLC
jgi:hypothetical protein